MIEMSFRTPLLITTHSTQMLDALTDHADSVLVCGSLNRKPRSPASGNPRSTPSRIEEASAWLWMRGHIGGALVKKLFVEGGGNNNDALAKECRDGFTRLLQKADLKNRLPKVIASGGRTAAFRDFKTALKMGSRDDGLFLLVDSEDPVEAHSAWQHSPSVPETCGKSAGGRRRPAPPDGAVHGSLVPR